MGAAMGVANTAKKYISPGSAQKTDESDYVKMRKGSGPKQDLKDIIRNRVEEMAERNAEARQADHPKLNAVQLKKLKNKERILEEMRIKPMILEFATTFSISVKWDLLYEGTEKQIKYFVVQVMPMASPDYSLECWSSLEKTPDERVTITCQGSEWTTIPEVVLDEEKRTIFLGGLANETPGLVFRVRGRHPVGWGNWSIPNEPFQPLSTQLAAPTVDTVESMPFALSVSWRPDPNWKSFGQLLYYRLLSKRVQSEGEDDIVPMRFFAPTDWEEIYQGRDYEFFAGCDVNDILSGIGKPLAPKLTYSFRVECAMGLNKSDKRYNSYFSSKEKKVKIKNTFPTKLSPPEAVFRTSTSIHIVWKAPFHDGGFSVVKYIVLGRRRLEDRDTTPLEYYTGSELSCTFGKDFSDGVNEPDGMELTAGLTYGFSVIAVNALGKSPPSEVLWVRVPTAEEEQAEAEAKLQEEMERLAADAAKAAEEQDELMASPDGMVDLPEGWKEYWDPKAEEMFYYNVITGENQWEHPGGAAQDTLIAKESEEDKVWRVFRKKRFRLLHELHQRAKALNAPKTPVKICIRRQNLVADSIAKLQRLDATALCRKLQVIYEGESGIDSGGLSKDWFLEFSNALLQPDLCLFKRTESGLYVMDQRSSMHAEAFTLFKMLGRMCGKALYDQQLINAPFCGGLMKQLVGVPPVLDDLREVDPILANSLQWMLDNDITDVIEETFTVTVEEFGSHREVELCERGTRRNVTEKNKAKYVEAVVRWHFNGAVRAQLRSFLEGLWEVAPSKDLSQFAPSELSMLFNGKPEIDVKDLQNGCVKYNGGYTAESKPVKLFWKVMEEFSHEQRAQVLRFSTGCDKVPLDGFPPFLPFTITKSEFDKGGLATAHTCFNQLVLPPYEDAASMKKKLLLSCEHGVGFEMS